MPTYKVPQFIAYRKISEEMNLVHVKKKKLYVLNETATIIFEHILNNKGEPEIRNALSQVFENLPGDISGEIESTIADLVSRGLLEAVEP